MKGKVYTNLTPTFCEVERVFPIVNDKAKNYTKGVQNLIYAYIIIFDLYTL